MEYPKSIKVGRKRYRVTLAPYAPKRGTMAEVDYRAGTITLGKQSRITNRSYRTEEMDDSFWHELTHAILHEMGSGLYCDEKFVTKFATLLTKAINSARF